MNNFDYNYGGSYSQNSFYAHSDDNLQSFSHFEQVSTETYDFDNSYQDINGSELVPSLYQSLEPTQLLHQFYYIVPQVTATEFGGTTYYQYAYFYYPVYSTIPHSSASYDSVSTTVSSSTSFVEYSENISHSMDLNSYTNATEINYTDVQFSSSLYESNHPQNNTQIYADNYYYYPNVGISGDSESDNLTTVCNSSGLSGDSSSLEAPNIQNEIDPRAQLKVLKDRLYIIALSGKLRLKDSVPVVDVLPTVEEEVNFIEDDDDAEIPVEELEMDEHNSVPLEKDEHFNSIYEMSASYEKRGIVSMTKNIKFKNDDSKSKFQGSELDKEKPAFTEKSYGEEIFEYNSQNTVQDFTDEVKGENVIITYKNDDFIERTKSETQCSVPECSIEVADEASVESYYVNENLNYDEEIKVVDWSIEVEDETSVETYDVNENLNDDNEIKVLDWTIEVEEDDCKQGYDDTVFKTEISSSSNEFDEYDSKKVTEYHKEQLYIWALSGYMNNKDEVPRVDILPVIEEEVSFLEDDCESDLIDEYNKDRPPDLLRSCEILDRVIVEPNSKDSIDNFGITDLERSIEKTKHDETDCCFNAVKSKREHPSYLEKECFKSAESSEKMDLISSSKGDYANRNFSKEKEEIEETLNEDPSIAPFYDVDLHQSDIGFYPESTIENEKEIPCKIKKKRFESIRNWFRSLWCCGRNQPT